MSINFCSIDRSSINSFCGSRRQVVLDRLLDEKYPVAPPAVITRGGNPQNIRNQFQIARPFEYEEQPVLTFEQPFITVSVELHGKTGSQTLENQPQAHFVTVTGLAIEPTLMVSVSDMDFDTGPMVTVSDLDFDDPVSVNISDLNI
jgi:hypothetical protein